MVEDILEAERQYLARLLEAIQRCAYFLHASDGKIAWPLEGRALAIRKKDRALFESLSAINERFAKLQDTDGSTLASPPTSLVGARFIGRGRRMVLPKTNEIFQAPFAR